MIQTDIAKFKILFRVIAIGGFALLASCGSSEPAASVQKPHREAGAAASIDPGVFEPYKRQGWQKLFVTWGDKGVARIQRLREAAAKNVAMNPACDAVETSDISESRSTPPNAPVVYVDCKNGERFSISEQDLGSVISTEMGKGARFSGAELIQKCMEAVRKKLSLPSTFDQSIFSVSDRQGLSGNRVIEFDFEAKNRLGLTLPGKASCIMTTQGEFEVTIVE